MRPSHVQGKQPHLPKASFLEIWPYMVEKENSPKWTGWMEAWWMSFSFRLSIYHSWFPGEYGWIRWPWPAHLRMCVVTSSLCNALLGQKGVDSTCWLESWVLSMTFHSAAWLICMVRIQELSPSWTGMTEETWTTLNYYVQSRYKDVSRNGHCWNIWQCRKCRIATTL